MEQKRIFWNLHGIMPLSPGLEETMRIFRQDGFLQGVLSENIRGNILGRSSPPSPHLLQFMVGQRSLAWMLEHYGWERKNTFCISDNPSDMRLANRLGIIPVALAFGRNPEESLMKERPAYVAERHEGIVPFILGPYLHRKGI